MGRKRQSSVDADVDAPSGTIPCPFSVAVDSNEYGHGTYYRFQGLRANADQKNQPYHVPLIFKSLHEGDYQVEGIPDYAVERKTKEDLFQSIAREENFRERLAILSKTCPKSDIVVECQISDIIADPPQFRHPKTGKITTYPLPKRVLRTIDAWTFDFPTVHWWFLWDRRAAEAKTFRLLFRHWKRKRDEAC